MIRETPCTYRVCTLTAEEARREGHVLLERRMELGVLSPDTRRMLEHVHWTPTRASARAEGMGYVLPHQPMGRLPIVIEPRAISPPIHVPDTLPTLNDLTTGRLTPRSPPQNIANVGTPL